MGLRVKILVALSTFLLVMLAAYSIIAVQLAARWARVANRKTVSELSARLARAIERAADKGSIPEGRGLVRLLRAELDASGEEARRCAVVLTELEDGEEGRTLVELGAPPGDDALAHREMLLVADSGGGQRKLRLEVAVPAKGFADMLAEAYGPLLAGSALTLVLGAALFAFVNRAYLRPVMQLRRAAQEVAGGRLEAEVNVRTGDELEELGESFAGMLDRLAEMQELALDANPLTGLPGNTTIQQFLGPVIGESRARAVVYVDLDSFKAYNDAYGFEAGDRVISFVAELLTDVCPARDGEAFVGHIGGDDFIFVVDSALAREAGEEILRRFDARIEEFYSPEDRGRGYIVSKDRQHREQRFPLMGLSLACVDTGQRSFKHFSELAAAAAEVKSQAKKQPGSVFMTDRRRS